MDATDNSAVAKAFAQTEEELGKLNIVVPNAGTAIWRPFAYLEFDEWWKIMELHVKAPLFLTQLAIKSMRERNEGTVIAITSGASLLNLRVLTFYFVLILRLLTSAQPGCRPIARRSKVFSIYLFLSKH